MAPNVHQCGFVRVKRDWQSYVDGDPQLPAAPLAGAGYEGTSQAPFKNGTSVTMVVTDVATGKDESCGVGTYAPGPCERI